MHNLVDWYHKQCSEQTLTFDSAQLDLLGELDNFLTKFARLNFITRRWFQPNKLGYYIYGDVGRGKSMIMNIMYQQTHGLRKNRWHYHEFMREIHLQLANLTAGKEPLKIIAKQLKQRFDIIYLDEMHVSDIASAMIMKELLTSLFDNNIYIVTSSNYLPDQLWPNGLMRERFLPAIELIKHKLNIVSLNAKQDYRLINNSFNQLFIKTNEHAKIQLTQIFNSINLDNDFEVESEIIIAGRKIHFIQQAADLIWFDFAVICGDMRGQIDYIELATQFKWFIISDVPALTSQQKDIARRFTWLIDILYDNGCKLSLSGAVSIYEIYVEGDFSNEFTRTISRLEEMQTKEYLQKDLTVKTASAYNIALES